MLGGRPVRLLAALMAPVLVGVPAAWAQEDQVSDRVTADRVIFEPLDGARVVIEGRIHPGALTVDGHSGGLALVEEMGVEAYLLGIREVPFSWPEEALAAQAVAARTYLAWTLARGRSSNGRTFGYDICATTACQVYRGVGGLDDPDGSRWVGAVQTTAGQILVHGGAPIQAMYSSTSDGRTRNVEDVFTTSPARPYLQAVPSPGETSPFVEWEFVLTRDQAEDMLRHAGLVEGDLVDVTSNRTPDGQGPWTVTVSSSGGSVTIDTWTLRSRLNRAAADLYPDIFPVHRPGSTHRFPQTIMSPNYTIRSELYLAIPGDGPPGLEQRFRVRGGGWGHLVGMSQYGAEAMARAGATYDQILTHYYGGAEPVASSLLPESIRVGLDTDLAEVRLVPDGPMRVTIDGEQVADGELGSWAVTWADGQALVDPPVGLGLEPELFGWRAFFDARGAVEVVTVRSRTAAEIRIVVREDQVVIADSGWMIRDAGAIAIDLEPQSFRAAITIQVLARSPSGGDVSTFRVLGGAE